MNLKLTKNEINILNNIYNSFFDITTDFFNIPISLGFFEKIRFKKTYLQIAQELDHCGNLTHVVIKDTFKKYKLSLRLQFATICKYANVTEIHPKIKKVTDDLITEEIDALLLLKEK